MSASDDRFDKDLAKIAAGVALRDRVIAMKDQGYSNAEIAETLGIPEVTIRRVSPDLES